MLRVTIHIGVNATPVIAALDSCAQGNFISRQFAETHSLSMTQTDTTLAVKLADGRVIKQKKIKARVHISCGVPKVAPPDDTAPNHTSRFAYSRTINFTVLDAIADDQDIILGTPFFQATDPHLNFSTRTVTFWPDNDDEGYALPVVEVPADLSATLSSIFAARPLTMELFNDRRAFDKQIRADTSGAQQLFSITATQLDELTAHQPTTATHDAARSAQLMADVLAKHPRVFEPLGTGRSHFDRPPHHHMRVPLKDSPSPPSRRLYTMSPAKLDFLRTELKKLLDLGHIVPTDSLWLHPVLVAMRPGSDKMRLCIDFRYVNEHSEGDGNAISNPKQIFAAMTHSSIYSVIDLTAAFHQLPLWGPHQQLLSMSTPLGNYAWCVAPFGYKRSSQHLQTVMLEVLGPVLYKTCGLLADDIIIWSKTWADHERDLHDIFDRLDAYNLRVKPEKLQLGQRQVKYLGRIVSAGRVAPDPEQLRPITDMSLPTTFGKMRSALGFAGWFSQHTPRFATLAAPLHAATQGMTTPKTPIEPTPDLQEAWAAFTDAVAKAIPLDFPDFEHPFTLYTDASDDGWGGVLTQGTGKDCNIIGLCSGSWTAAQAKYSVYHRELRACMFALQHFRDYVAHAHTTAYICTDHKPAPHILHQSTLANQAQERAVLYLQEADVALHYTPGSANPADWPSRMPRLIQTTDEPLALSLQLATTTAADAQPHWTASLQAITVTELRIDPGFTADIKDSYQHDLHFSNIITLHRAGTPSAANYSLDDNGLLWLQADPQLPPRLCIPRHQHLGRRAVDLIHSTPASQHPGYWATYKAARQRFYWPGMAVFVRRYVKACHACQTAKPFAAAQPIVPIHRPGIPWQHLQSDFMDMPKADTGENNLWIVVDMFTRRARFIPCHKSINARDCAMLYIQHIYSQHGISASLASDRDPRFTAEVYKEIMAALTPRLAFTTANNPRADGGSEAVVKIVRTAARIFADYQQSNWTRFVPLLEFAYNSRAHSQTGAAPFLLDIGRLPTAIPDLIVTPPHPPDAAQLLHDFQQARAHAMDAMQEAQDEMARRTDPPAKRHVFQAGQQVLVNKAAILTAADKSRPHYKSIPTWHGPYQVLRVDPNTPTTAQVDLPANLRVHANINARHLRPYFIDEANPREQQPPPIHLPDGDEFQVAEVLQHHSPKPPRKQPTFLVRFTGEDLSQSRWLTRDQLVDEDGTMNEQYYEYLKSTPRAQRYEPHFHDSDADEDDG